MISIICSATGAPLLTGEVRIFSEAHVAELTKQLESQRRAIGNLHEKIEYLEDQVDGAPVTVGLDGEALQSVLDRLAVADVAGALSLWEAAADDATHRELVQRAVVTLNATRRQHGHQDPAVVALVTAAKAVRDALDLVDAGSSDECQRLIEALNLAIVGVVGPAKA